MDTSIVPISTFAGIRKNTNEGRQIFGSIQGGENGPLGQTLENAGQYYKFLNSYNAVGSGDFSFAPSKMTYTGQDVMFFKCSLHLSFKVSSGGGASDIYHIAFLVNDVKQSGICKFQVNNTTDRTNECSIESIFPVANGGVITVGIQNETTANADIDIYSYSFTCCAI